ncbi:hypothetical protein ASE14_00975 [Agromyces sp. Root81]|uniref:DUF1266 domain-containing protein n=1 Tax=Agromyces sp. Root81 TaxID=1736601 RepID=UPI0006FD6DBE|nr:DUF1266 domain-containing protein [Agromyces sp. Root81]KRC62442.1 hypothetical protein ASE14_00975 [Agromyces sp. Root81]
MRPAARVDLNNFGDIIGWLLGQWWVYLIIGVIVLLVLLGWLLPDAKVRALDGYPTTGTEADELALGFLQIRSDPVGHWNDPTASHLTEKWTARLVDQWGVDDRESWLETIDRLMKERRRREVWTLYLAVRADLIEQLGRAPKTKEWLSAITEAGGTDKRSAKAFVNAVEQLEQETRKAAGKGVVTPATVVTTFDGYAFGQAVALATWGVALGHATEAEGRAIIHEVNAVARPAFSSWPEFGLSYVVGRVMHWSDGNIDDKTFSRLGDPASEIAAACSEKRLGPWASLPWTL